MRLLVFLALLPSFTLAQGVQRSAAPAIDTARPALDRGRRATTWSDTFSFNTVANYVTSNGTWAVSGGLLTGAQPQAPRAYAFHAGAGSFADGYIEVDLSTTNATAPYPEIVARYVNESTFFMLVIGSSVTLYEVGGLGRNWSWGGGLDSTVPTKWRVAMTANAVQVSRNGVVVIDATNVDVLTPGMWGVAAQNGAGTARFDNLVIRRNP